MTARASAMPCSPVSLCGGPSLGTLGSGSRGLDPRLGQKLGEVGPPRTDRRCCVALLRGHSVRPRLGRPGAYNRGHLAGGVCGAPESQQPLPLGARDDAATGSPWAGLGRQGGRGCGLGAGRPTLRLHLRPGTWRSVPRVPSPPCAGGRSSD